MADDPSPEDESSAVPPGIDAPAVTAWLAERVDVAVPLRWDRIPGGRSNLTFRVTDADGRRFVMRRPPLHSVLASAHDVAREYRIMAALQHADVPVPPLVGVERDTDVAGAPFYVMGFVDAHVIRDPGDAAALSTAARRRAGQQVADVLARLHAIEPDDVGLGDLGRREDYLPRQLHRWRGQYDKGRSRDVPEIEALHARLVAAVPPQQGAAIVHGDYRLDNLMVDDDGSVVAVLDWELCTLGDPLADVGLLAVYWDPFGRGHGLPLIPAAAAIEGIGPFDDVLARYAERSERDLGSLDTYVAFGYWKLAVILEGVLARVKAGAYGEVDADDVATFTRLVPALAQRGAEVADRAGI
jgi:aminoglycoside phosphotransferase (APT) family kinase protein